MSFWKIYIIFAISYIIMYHLIGFEMTVIIALITIMSTLLEKINQKNSA